MKAQVIKFPRERRGTPCWNPPADAPPCIIVVLPVVRVERECPKVRELRARSKMLREHFKAHRPSGGTCSGGEG